jgi:hypothetical protein
MKREFESEEGVDMSSEKYRESGYNLDLDLEFRRHPLSIDFVVSCLSFLRVCRDSVVWYL